MNYTGIKEEIFEILDQKTSWGRNELKEKLNGLFLELADEHIIRIERPSGPPLKREVQEPGTVANLPTFPADNIPW